ncbi:kinetochore protein Spc25 [Electrophorus electricus]|uniref:Kinetochore protein SPC25 n=1 Tax=Electrophorus electricus TaxID=8005 RepID=A0A4W4HLH0_ELEEL|nr:kinetochore protein Spc25 [Electrophorus electricus]XP_035390953.1 kinetochore protein Spc25 [Electrophorus electricus]
MATIRDPDVGETFNSKLEEIRSKLLTQAMGEVMNDATAEFSQAHRHYMTSILDTCSKKCREDETMFQTIQTYMEDIKHKRAAIKEKLAEVPEIVEDIGDKENSKENLIKKIEKLKMEQVKERELIDSQNKANKARLKNLNKIKEIFQERLSLEIRKIQGEKLQFIFRNINHKNPESAYTFLLRISEDGVYQMISCDPPLEQAVHLERKLQETNNFSAFLANVRKEFVALHNATKTA